MKTLLVVLAALMPALFLGVPVGLAVGWDSATWVLGYVYSFGFTLGLVRSKWGRL